MTNVACCPQNPPSDRDLSLKKAVLQRYANVAEKNEVSQILERAKQCGATITKPAQDVFWGGHSGYFADPDGFLWEVAWNPHWTLLPNGSLQLP